MPTASNSAFDKVVFDNLYIKTAPVISTMEYHGIATLRSRLATIISVFESGTTCETAYFNFYAILAGILFSLSAKELNSGSTSFRCTAFDIRH